MGQHAADVVQHEGEAGMLQDRAMGLLQDVAQVRVVVVANPADVRVQARLPGPVAHLAGELSDVLRVARRLAAVESLQPARTAHLPQVRGEFAVVDGRPGDEEHFGLHASHGTGDYRHPATVWRTRMSRGCTTILQVTKIIFEVGQLRWHLSGCALRTRRAALRSGEAFAWRWPACFWSGWNPHSQTMPAASRNG